ncbi:MAG: hypothetical protein JO250_20975 [Armatimonadetes bacterium]|nr:hypothetical protein [Armatimonadota bacterium]
MTNCLLLGPRRMAGAFARWEYGTAGWIRHIKGINFMRDIVTTRPAKRRTKPGASTPAGSQFAATPEKMQPFLRALAQEMEARQRTVLGDPVTPRALLAAAGDAQRQFGRTWDHVQSLNVVPHACRPGCDHCCFLTVEASAPEVFLIAEHVRTALAPEQLACLRGHLHRTAERIQRLTPAERVRADVPCALLEDGRCAAYPVRPLACRAWNSRDAAACARMRREGGGDLRPVQDQRPLGIDAGIQAGLTAALRAAGLPEDAERPCELNTALCLALDEPQSLERWAGGEDVLAPARAAVDYER